MPTRKVFPVGTPSDVIRKYLEKHSRTDVVKRTFTRTKNDAMEMARVIKKSQMSRLVDKFGSVRSLSEALNRVKFVRKRFEMLTEALESDTPFPKEWISDLKIAARLDGLFLTEEDLDVRHQVIVENGMEFKQILTNTIAPLYRNQDLNLYWKNKIKERREQKLKEMEDQIKPSKAALRVYKRKEKI